MNLKYIALSIVAIAIAAFVWFVAFSDMAGGHWKEAQRQNTIESYQAFLSQHPQGKYSQLASNELARLQEQKAWTQVNATPTVAALRSFQKQFPDSSKVSESLVMLTNAFLKEWDAIKTAFERERYSDYVALGPPQNLEAKAQFMLRVMDRAKEFGIVRLQSTSLQPSDISSTGKFLTFECKGPMNLGPLSLPDGVVMEVSCSSDIVLQNQTSNPGVTTILCWGLGGLPKGARIATQGIFYSNRLNPTSVSVSDAKDSVLMMVKTKDGSLFKFNDSADGDAFFIPVALLNPNDGK